MKLDDLPRYVEAPNGGMWLLPENFVAETNNIFVRLDDVKDLWDRHQRAEFRRNNYTTT